MRGMLPRTTRKVKLRYSLSKADQLRFGEYHRMLDGLEPAVFRAFIKALNRLDIPFARVQELFEAGRLADIMVIIGFETFEREFAALMTPELEKILVSGQKWAAAQLPDVSELIEGSFAVISPDVLAALEQHAANFITGVVAEQKLAVRRYLIEAFKRGESGFQLASALSKIVGLTERQAVAVGNFSAAVDEVFAGELSEASVRARYRLAPRIRGNAEKVKRSYRSRMLLHRGEVIARHETISAFSRGRHATWDRMAAAGAFKQGTVIEWLTTPDERACPICVPLHGLQFSLGGSINSIAGPIDMPPAHIGCRCDTRVIIDPANIRISPERAAANQFLEDRKEELSQP